MMKRNAIFLILVSVVLVCSPVLGYWTNWLGHESNEWSDDANWSAGEPTTGATARIYNGNPVITEEDEYVHYNLYIGYAVGDNGTVTMNSGSLYVGSPMYVGNSGTGLFEQYGGVVNAMVNVVLGRNTTGVGTYDMEGGTLNGDIGVYDGTGTFNHHGGTITGNSIVLPSSGDGSGTYNAYAGAFADLEGGIELGEEWSGTGTGTLNIMSRRAHIEVDSGIYLWNNSYLTAVPGSRVIVTQNNDVWGGKVWIKNTDASALSGLRNLTIVFDNGIASDYSELEVAGEDLGADDNGFCTNFDLDQLIVGEDGVSYVKLVDSYDNGNRGGVGGAAEALYVRKLVVSPGSTLDFNFLHVYCLEMDVQGTTLHGSAETMWTVDTDDSGFIDEVDLAAIGANWLQSCTCGDWCGGADIDRSFRVDGRDLAMLAMYWLTDGSAPPFYSEMFNSDPGWTAEGQWEFGVPLGGGGLSGGNPDPTSGYTGSNVYGVNLAGDYSLTAPGAWVHLTSGPIDCTGKSNVQLQYRQWLNCPAWSDSYHVLKVSDSGGIWHNAWYDSAAQADSEWRLITVDISDWADNNPNLILQWRYQANTGLYSGWNIDDVKLTEAP